MNIIFLGAPGAGKGTQSALLVERFGYSHVSVGEALREEARGNIELSNILSEGRLAPLHMVESVLERFIAKSGDNILFDGVPRNLDQVEMLERIFDRLGKRIDLVIFLNLNIDKIADRILNRWTCIDGSEETTLSGTREELSTKCKGTLSKREDDNVDTLKKRLDTYSRESLPLVALYRERGILREIDASASKQEVFKSILKVIDDIS